MINNVSTDIDTIWKQFLTLVTEEAGSGVVETWLKAVSLHRWDALQKIAYIKAPNVFVKDWIERHYIRLFVEHLSRLYNVEAIKIVFLDNISLSTPVTDTRVIPAQRLDTLSGRKQIINKKAISRGSNYINEGYVFDSFVVGPNNSLAYAASHAVTEHLGTLYNPLFIYGGSGLGKTHLLHAIGNKLCEQDTNIRILYQSAERFVHEFIYAIRFDKVHAFRERYKNIDMLLIDDVQFISNKEQTQEAFFHIFNSLYEANKQIVFSSDSYPADIVGLAGRLCSRFLWGLVTDIQIPNLETKIAILTQKADDQGARLNDEVIHYIAAQSVGT